MLALSALFLVSSITIQASSLLVMGQHHDIIEVDGVVYSINCQSTCKAVKAVAAYRKKPFPIVNKKKFYSKPSSVLCRDYWQEVSLLALDKNKNQRALCLFDDKSFVELESLDKVLKR